METKRLKRCQEEWLSEFVGREGNRGSTEGLGAVGLLCDMELVDA